MANRLALFDCDGTLVDSAADICTAMVHCFEAHALPPPPAEATRLIIGLSLVEAMAALHPDGGEDQHHAMTADYKRAFQALRGKGQVNEPLFDGMAEVIARLHQAGWLLGVATGKSDRGLAMCLERHAIAHHFVTLQTADRHPSKPHPAMVLQAMADAGATPGTTVVIGDSSYDMVMAKAAGCRAIGVAWGYHDTATLLAEGADHLARDPAELIALMEALP